MKIALTILITFLVLFGFGQDVNRPFIVSKASKSAAVQVGTLASGTPVFSENFETGTSFPLNGITVKTKASDGGFKIGNASQSNTGQVWKVPSGTKFAYTSDDACNCNKSADSILLPVQNLSPSMVFHLNFRLYFNRISPNEKTMVLAKNNGQIRLLATIKSENNWQDYSIPLTGLSGNVQVVFSYSDGGRWGTGLAIDDVSICEPDEGVNLKQNGMLLNGMNPENFYNYIPTHQAALLPIDIATELVNFGKFAASNTRIQLQVGGYGNISNTSAPYTQIANDDTVLEVYKNYVPSNGIGEYQIELTAISDTVESVTEGDTLQAKLFLSDSVFSRIGSEQPSRGFWYGPGVQYDLSSLIEIRTPDTATSISVFIHENSAVGDTFDVIILNEFYQNRVIPQAFPQLNENIEIKQEHLGKWSTFTIPNTPLAIGNYYVGIKSRTDSVIIGVSETEAASGVSFVNIGTGYTSSSYLPFVRLNVQPRSCSIQGSVSVTNTNCGASTGVATVQMTQGVAPYKYSWGQEAEFDSTSSISNLSAGNYSVVVSDSLGCTINLNGEVNDIGAPQVVLKNKQDETCFGNNAGLIDVGISGGTLPYAITWSNAATDSSITGLSAGIYKITVSDNANCKTVQRINVEGPRLPLSVSFDITDNFCFNEKNGKLRANVLGGVPEYNFLWADTSFKTNAVSGVESGIYKVTVTDDNGCSIDDSASIGGTAPILITSTVLDTANLATITIEATGGSGLLNYSWKGPDGFADPRTQNLENLRIRGEYILFVTDENNCVQTDTMEVAGVVNTSNISPQLRIQIYPNPSRDVVTIRFTEMATGELLLFDPNGSLVMQETYNEQEEVVIQKPFSGVFILKIMNEGQPSYKRLVFTD